MADLNERSRPIGFYNFGVCYLDVARAAHSSGASFLFADPLEYLIAHGLELIFKADLRRTRSEDSVRRIFRHDLLRMQQDLSEEFCIHFQIGDELKELVRYLSDGHSAPDWRNRYLITGFRSQSRSPGDMISIVSRFTTNNRRWLFAHFSGQTI